MIIYTLLLLCNGKLFDVYKNWTVYKKLYKIISDVSRPFGSLVYWFGHPTLAPKKGFLTSFFSVAIQQRNTLKKSKWLRRQKINRRRRIERRDCLQKCFHSFK